ncbi:MAG TPA: hypothetical protein VK849_15820, partial [Longimicrobiales bacterium]|nr:hypothetical protein [Longimicrobiales bacterium]
MSGGRARRALAATSFALLGAALLAGVLLAVAAGRAAEGDVLRAETASAAELWGRGGDVALERYIPGRWRVARGGAASVDRPVVAAGEARAAVHDADGWDVLGTLTVRRREGGRAGLPTGVAA